MASATKNTKKRRNAPEAREATSLLRADHKLVSGLFAEYDKARSAARKKLMSASV